MLDLGAGSAVEPGTEPGTKSEIEFEVELNSESNVEPSDVEGRYTGVAESGTAA